MNRSIFVLIFFISLLFSKDIDYSYALNYAKEGKYDIAIKEFKNLYKKYPKNYRLYYDYITILGWAGKDKEVIKLSKDIEYKNMPDYTLEIVAKSYRNLKDYKNSINLYRLCLEKNPQNLDCTYGLILAYSDNKDYKNAFKILNGLKNKNYYYYFLKGYIYESKRDFFNAFINYQKAYRLNPKDNDSLKGLVRVLDLLGLPYLSEKYILKNPKIFDKNELYRIEKDKIAFKIRWGEIVLPEQKDRFKEIDEALKKLNNFLKKSKSKTLKEENPIFLQARFDRLVALRDRFYMDEVIKDYKRLKKENIKLPYYALNAVGDAYLYKKEPEKAYKLYKKALKRNPKHFESKIGIFYSLVEMFRLNDAIKWIDEVDKNEPAWIKSRYENSYKQESHLASANARYYADYMDEAQKRLESMLNIAPANVDIRTDLASVYKDRGWPRVAKEETDFALAYEPRNSHTQLIKALSLFDANRFKESEKIIYDIYKKYPEDLQIQRAKKIYEIYKNKNELFIDLYAGSSSGVELGNNYFYIESKLYSKPINYNYRLYLIGLYSKTDLLEGKEKFKRFGIATEYKKRDLIANIGFLKNKNIDKNSWFIDGKYFFTDRWIGYAAYESYSKDTPLRALKNGVFAKSYDAIITYRANESRESSVEFKRMDFNDTNRRDILTLTHYERIVTGPYYKLNTTISFYSSRNSLEDAAYFNPKKDRFLGIDFENIWHLYKRYSKSFSHVLGFSIGNYWQKYYGSNAIGSIRYEHRWSALYRFDLIYGISRSKSYYDGDKEYDTTFYLTLDWRF